MGLFLPGQGPHAKAAEKLLKELEIKRKELDEIQKYNIDKKIDHIEKLVVFIIKNTVKDSENSRRYSICGIIISICGIAFSVVTYFI